MHRLRRTVTTEGRRLLRVLFVWLRALPTHPGGAFGRGQTCCLLLSLNAMTDASLASSRDWLGSWRSNALAWWLPHAALVAGLLAPVPVRIAVWIVAFLWMGLACIANSRRCGRTHCRYTGPYYLAMIAPVLALGISWPSVGTMAWLILGVVTIAGSKLIWWATEQAWGKFS
jgi:hypothetical protein